MRGLILSAPSSGAGKTTITLGLLRHFRQLGLGVRGAKSGPDYIDPRFHAAASGKECFNLDAWAMSPARIRSLAAGSDPVLIEGAMGLFDGAPPVGKGSTADLARHLDLPVVLVVDASKQAQSVAALVKGFQSYSPDVSVMAVILNNVGSARHERMLRLALTGIAMPVLGAIPRTPALQTPSRHLGLVQAAERPDLELFLDQAAALVGKHVDMDALAELFEPLPDAPSDSPLAPPAQTISIASDAAFAFAYPHLMRDWQRQGAEVKTFSPLANEAPPQADLVYLPGGYPELHAGKIAAAETFLSGLRRAKAVYGECGGYMVMGDGLIDANGARHAMAGLLQLETDFSNRKLHLGYRRLETASPLWPSTLLAHEFHYATTLKAIGPPLFNAQDAEGNALPDMGLRNGPHSGSFAHVIDQAVA